MRNYRSSAATVSVAMLALTGVAGADEAAAPAAPAAPAAAAAAPAKYTGPTLSDILMGSGLTATGYVDATYGYSHNDSLSQSGPNNCNCKTDYNSFALNQAGFTLAMQPMSGFGGLVNVVAGSDPYNGLGNGALAGHVSTLNQSSTSFYLMQGFAQYAGGPWTIQAGKFGTLAGAEVFAPNGNTNVTRSILFNYEPVTHTGVRATYAASDKVSLIAGVNNGWTGSQELADGSDKTGELGLSVTPNKMLSWTLQSYFGRDYILWNPNATPTLKAQVILVDTVLTWNATSALTLVGTADYGNVGSATSTPSASWWGVAGYVNYALSDQWRVSVRGEYFDDTDGYWTGAYLYSSGKTAGITTHAEKLEEGTVTLGYDPAKNFELRIEGRADFPSPSYGTTNATARLYESKTYQGWLEAQFKF